MRRRPLLALVASSVAGVTGCSSRRSTPVAPDSGGTDPGTLPPASATLDLGETFEHPDGWSLTLAEASVHRIVLRRGTHVDPIAFSGGQYVRYRVTADGDANGPDRGGVLPDPARLAVTLDGRDASPGHRGFWAGHVGEPDGYEGTMITPVRTAAADEAGIRWRRADGAVEWRLPATVRRAIAHAPSFLVTGFEVPDAVSRNAAFEVTLTVENVGDRDGRFLAELGSTMISDTPELRFPVPAGETVEHVTTVEPYVSEDAEQVTLVLNWGLGRRRVTVPIG